MKNKTKSMLNRVSAAVSAAVLSTFMIILPAAEMGTVSAIDADDGSYACSIPSELSVVPSEEVVPSAEVVPTGDPLYNPDNIAVGFSMAYSLGDGTVTIGVNVPDGIAPTLSAGNFADAISTINEHYLSNPDCTYTISLSDYTMFSGETIEIPTSAAAPMISSVGINGLIVPEGCSAALINGTAAAVTGVDIAAGGTLTISGGGNYNVSSLYGHILIADSSEYTIQVDKAISRTLPSYDGTILTNAPDNAYVIPTEAGWLSSTVPGTDNDYAVIYFTHNTSDYVTITVNAGKFPYTINDKYHVGDKIDAEDINDGGMPPIISGTYRWFSLIGEVASETAWDFDNDTVPGNMVLDCYLSNAINYYNYDGTELFKTEYFKESVGRTSLYIPEIVGFSGWHTEPDGAGTLCTSVSPNSGDVELYSADASSNDISITYDAAGGVMPVEYPQTIANGETITLPLPTKAGCTFLGWFCRADGNIYNNTLSNVTSDISLVAKWTVPLDNAVFVVRSGGSEYGFANGDWTDAFAMANDKTTDVYLKQTYEFDGSGGNMHGCTLKRYPGFSGIMINVSAEHNNYATLYLSDGTINGQMTEFYGSAVVPDNSASATGTVIYIKEDSYGADIANVTIRDNKFASAGSKGGAVYCGSTLYINHTGNGNSVTTISGCSAEQGGAIYSSDNVYYQKGIINIIDNTDLDGNQNNVFCVNGSSPRGYNANPNESSRVGLSFPDDFDYIKHLYVSSPVNIFYSDRPDYEISLVDASYLEFVPVIAEYDITYNVNGGSWDSLPATSYTYGTAFTLPTNLTKTNCIFAGWYDNADLYGDAVTAIPAAASGDKAYYAKWTTNRFAITYNYSGGTPQNEDFSTSYGVEQGIVMPSLVRSGFVFAGWVVVKTGSTDVVYSGRRAPRGITGDITVTAVWSRAYTPSRTERFR